VGLGGSEREGEESGSDAHGSLRYAGEVVVGSTASKIVSMAEEAKLLLRIY